MQPTLAQLDHAEKDVFLYLNRKGESVFSNRIKKFLRHPLKYLYLNLCKAGILPWREGVHARAFWGGDFYVPLRDVNAVTLYYTGALSVPEIILSRFFIKNLKEGDVFYDVGANMGYYCNLAHALGASVHAFEPNPSVQVFLRHNAPGATIHEIALSSTEGTVTLYDTTLSNKNGMSTTLESVARANKLTYTERTVPCTTLDSYVAKNTPPTYIKVDVEGFEEFVLTGAQKLLDTYAPVITMEVWDAPQAIEHSRAAIELLTRAGYVSYKIQKNGDIAREEIVLGNLGTPSNYCFKKEVRSSSSV